MPAPICTLEELVSDHAAQKAASSAGLLHQLRSFDFVVVLRMLHWILKQTLLASDALRKEKTGIHGSKYRYPSYHKLFFKTSGTCRAKDCLLRENMTGDKIVSRQQWYSPAIVYSRD
jgi:hypothetical protein